MRSWPHCAGIEQVNPETQKIKDHHPADRRTLVRKPEKIGVNGTPTVIVSVAKSIRLRVLHFYSRRQLSFDESRNHREEFHRAIRMNPVDVGPLRGDSPDDPGHGVN
jgi:hypothetical protein